MNFLYIEHLTVRSWLFYTFSTFLRESPDKIFYFDCTRTGLKLAKLCLWFRKKSIEQLCFRLVEVRDEDGLLLRLRIPHKDLIEFSRELTNDPDFRCLLDQPGIVDRMPMYLRKRTLEFTHLLKNSVARALFLIQVCHWHQSKNGGHQASLVLNQRFGMPKLIEYGRKNGIRIYQSKNFEFFLVKSDFLKMLYRQLRCHLWLLGNGSNVKESILKQKNINVAVDFYGQFNLAQPERYSDLFFYQQSDLACKNIVLLFHIPGDPLDVKKWDELVKHQIKPVVLDPRATTIQKCPPLPSGFMRGSHVKIPRIIRGRAGVELKKSIKQYWRMRQYWKNIFQQNNSKIYVTWFKYDSTHCPIADAIRDVGGVMGIYQRALDVTHFVETLLDVDMVFGYSRWMGELERGLGSKIPYFVVTGYLGDHRFTLLKDRAKRVRRTLHENGVKRIVSFTDENSSGDSRWHTGHEFMRENYSFLLEKLLQNPWLGLIIKPKVPSTLRLRLGEVGTLLSKAEATGRCIVYGDGEITPHGSFPPTAAALSADIAIHGHLCAPTAALECALAGVPTLLLDREGWKISPLYELGEGKVVFKKWDDLWDACRAKWDNNDEAIGNWSPMLDRLDPFRDGQAAKRMGTFLQWMIEGFKSTSDPNRVLANAAEQYCAAWGQDKIMRINVD